MLVGDGSGGGAAAGCVAADWVMGKWQGDRIISWYMCNVIMVSGTYHYFRRVMMHLANCQMYNKLIVAVPLMVVPLMVVVPLMRVILFLLGVV